MIRYCCNCGNPTEIPKQENQWKCPNCGEWNTKEVK